MKFLPSLLGGGRQVEYKAEEIERAAQAARYISWGVPVAPTTWDLDRVVSDGYERVIWLWRGVDAIADKASRLTVRAVRESIDSPDDLQYVDDPLLERLNKASSPWERATDFRYRLSSQLLLSKAGVFVEVVRNRGGGVASLSLLPPNRVKVVPDPDEFISSFEIQIADGQTFYLPPFRQGSSETNSVLWVRKPHPTDPYSGTTPLEAAGISIDLDFWARLYNRTFMQNDGRPGGVLAIRGQLAFDDAEELRRRFSGGPATAGRTSVIEADDVSWVDTATSPRDAQYVESRAITKEEILLSLGVPETIIGNASGRTYDNADAEREVFWEETMIPHLNLIERALDQLTQGGDDDDVRLWHDTSKVEVLKRSSDKRRDIARSEFDAGLISVDEYRESTGRDPEDRPGSRVLWLAAGKFAVGDESDEQSASELTVVGGQAPAPEPQPEPEQVQTAEEPEVPLTDEDVLRVAMTTAALIANVEEKYDPSQPRDWMGRWSRMGGILGGVGPVNLPMVGMDMTGGGGARPTAGRTATIPGNFVTPRQSAMVREAGEVDVADKIDANESLNPVDVDRVVQVLKERGQARSATAIERYLSDAQDRIDNPRVGRGRLSPEEQARRELVEDYPAERILGGKVRVAGWVMEQDVEYINVYPATDYDEVNDEWYRKEPSRAFRTMPEAIEWARDNPVQRRPSAEAMARTDRPMGSVVTDEDVSPFAQGFPEVYPRGGSPEPDEGPEESGDIRARASEAIDVADELGLGDLLGERVRARMPNPRNQSDLDLVVLEEWGKIDSQFRVGVDVRSDSVEAIERLLRRVAQEAREAENEDVRPNGILDLIGYRLDDIIAQLEAGDRAIVIKPPSGVEFSISRAQAQALVAALSAKRSGVNVGSGL